MKEANRFNGEPKSESLAKSFLPNLFAFAIGLAMAWFLNWETTDLVWSLWLTSLVIGYATILSVLLGAAVFGVRLIGHDDFPKKYVPALLLLGLGGGLFFLGFFSLHFCGFHAGHSVFLNSFFPIEGMPVEGFGDAFMNPILLWKLVFQYLVAPYGLFLLPALLVEREHIFGPLRKAWGREVEPTDVSPLQKPNALGSGMFRPYVNVVRMHILIFFFAACHLLKIESFFVYAVVYSVYFFPWSDVVRRFKGKAGTGDTAVAQ